MNAARTLAVILLAAAGPAATAPPPETLDGRVTALDAASRSLVLLVENPAVKGRPPASEEIKVTWNDKSRFVWRRAGETPKDAARRAGMARGSEVPVPGSGGLGRPAAPSPSEEPAAAADLALRMRLRAKGPRDASGSLAATDLWLEPLPAPPAASPAPSPAGK